MIDWSHLLTVLCDQAVGEWPLADDRSPARAATLMWEVAS